jgi:hypothetical protein
MCPVIGVASDRVASAVKSSVAAKAAGSIFMRARISRRGNLLAQSKSAAGFRQACLFEAERRNGPDTRAFAEWQARIAIERETHKTSQSLTLFRQAALLQTFESVEGRLRFAGFQGVTLLTSRVADAAGHRSSPL